MVSKLTKDLIAREGGYVNDPDDPGGATKYGITIQTLRDFRGDQSLQPAHVAALTKEQAAQIYEQEYLHGPKISRLPEPLVEPVYDMQVNTGSRAVRLLQGMCVRLGADIAVDGQIGPITIAACKGLVERYGRQLIRDAYGHERLNYYYNLAESQPPLRKYVKRRDGGKAGWIARAEEFISDRWRLTDMQHAERVSRW